MDFVIAAALFGLVFLGVALVCQAIIGGEVRPLDAAFGKRFGREYPGPSDSPDKHPWRLAGTGLALIAIAIGLGVVLV